MTESDRPADSSIRDLLLAAKRRIAQVGSTAPAGSCETPYLDALILMSESTGLEKERLLADLDLVPAPEQSRLFKSLLDRRCAGNPVSYLLGRKEFYGRTFIVGPDVLVPRPETELLVDIALQLIDSSPTRHLHDCCTGSGCVAITIAAERLDVIVTASDISPNALDLARRNANAVPGGRPIEFWLSDCLVPVAEPSGIGVPSGAPRPGSFPGWVEKPGIITANPPYLSDNEYAAMAELGWPEPEIALRAGTDGLDLIRRLSAQAATVLQEGGWLLCEFGASQAVGVSEIFVSAGFGEVAIHQDLAGRDRVCVGRLESGHGR